ncbi:rhodanese-like domain-containing protein [Daejeonella oryzae]|uniref:rhodanese-like domain-containing protein n=1 Tax=Daejeonella oryzae TaxID=1122943 RepID=UPI000410F506|nr:rhodanese-like domain-containing protein [Daejeonella oryzae]
MNTVQHSNSFDKDGKSFKEAFKNTPNAVLLDVRTPEEFSSGTIDGAQNIDYYLSDFESKVLTLDKDKEYFIFCRSGNRSGKTCSILESNGFKAYNLQGGIDEWPK